MIKKTATTIAEFFKHEASGGVLLFLAAVLAMVFANSSLSSIYGMLLSTPVEFRVGELEVAKPLLLWINDGLMAVFFFLIGLELKREMVEGELADRRNIILPAVGALGGMAVPALFYAALNSGDSIAMQGWAIPAATDIAFALGVLSLLGNRVPVSVKVFLVSLAIFDDVGAIVIIAFFYTANLSVAALLIVALCIPILAAMNRFGVTNKVFYILVSLVMWFAMLKSGVHATLAGVIAALFIPIRSSENPDHSPLKELEHDLHSVVAFFILPVFAFSNAGINFSDMGLDAVFHNVPMGIALGLFLGKQVGIFGFCWVAIRIGIVKLPQNMSWLSLYGTSALCGIGFTMSLFIGSLAFEETGVDLLFDERVGILIGSVLSGVLGYVILRKSLKANAA